MTRPTSQGWIILRTAGRSTLGLAQSLAADGFEVWTPIEVLPRVPGTRNKGRRAMIPQYVFALGHHDDELCRLSHDRGRHARFSVVKVADRVARVRDAKLQHIRDAEEVSESLATPRKHISPYSRGAKVRVTKGIFSGMNGTVDRSDGREADVWMTMFGRHKRFTLPLYTLEDDEAKKPLEPGSRSWHKVSVRNGTAAQDAVAPSTGENDNKPLADRQHETAQR